MKNVFDDFDDISIEDATSLGYYDDNEDYDPSMNDPASRESLFDVYDD